MPVGTERRSRRMAYIVAGCVLIALLGVGAFWLALRPCRFAVAPGRALAWDLAVGTADLGPDGKPGPIHVATHRLVLVGVGPGDGAAALLSGPAASVPGAAYLVQVPEDGRLRATGRDGRPGEAGVAVAGFDFNLLALPPGAEQEWRPEVVWAALPPTHRAQACSAKRMRSGMRPEFRCEFPASVEWVDPATGRYRQVRDLVVTYRFDTLRGVPLSASGRYRIYDELPAPAPRRGREITFDLAWAGSTSAGDPARLRPLAAAGSDATAWADARRRPPAELLSRLREADGPFRGLGEGLLARLGAMSLPSSPALRLLAGLLLAASVGSAEIDRPVVGDPRLGLAWLPDRRSQEAWRSLFDPSPVWVTRELATLATLHADRLPTLWAARLLYRGEPWTRRDNEPSSLRRWRATDREVKLAVLRDLRWRRDAAFIPVLGAFLSGEESDAALAVSALASLWLIAPAEGRAAAARIADPRRADRLPPAGLPTARMAALSLLVEVDGPAAEGVRGALEWGLLSADGAERLAALGTISPGAVPDLVGACLQQLAQRLREGTLDDDATAAMVLACGRLGEAVGEAGARTLAEVAATAPRELACAASAAFARSVTWKNTIDPAPLAARLRTEPDPAVRHALFGLILRLDPQRIAAIPGAAGWAALARHRQALQEWAWQQYLVR